MWLTSASLCVAALSVLLLAVSRPIEGKTWIWQGALMPTSIRFTVKTDEPEVLDFRIVAAAEPRQNLSFARMLGQVTRLNLTQLRAEEPKGEVLEFDASRERVFHMVMEGLIPNMSYSWSAPGDMQGRFRTPPSQGTPFNFSFAFASCADNDSDHTLFSLIPYNQNPLFIVHMGDLHYGNIVRNDFNVFAYMYDRVLLRPNQAHLFSHLPVVYMWDDHDYGPNNADRFSPSREAALKAFSTFVPTYAKGSYEKDGSVYYSFTIGRILFVVTDTSSSRDPSARTTLGEEQLEWLNRKFQLLARKPNEFAALVWISTLPWIDDHYKWGEFAEERAKIGSWIDSFGLRDRIIIVSGDAHMVAVDDGSHSVGGVKVFHAAALDAKPTTKGGPYSHGVWPGRNQYGTMEVLDLGERICFRFQGWRWKRDMILSRIVEFDTCDSSKNIPYLYKPSPFFVQKAWKSIKRLLEASGLSFGTQLTTLIDSTRMTANDLTDPLVLLPVLAAITLASSLIRNIWARCARKRPRVHDESESD